MNSQLEYAAYFWQLLSGFRVAHERKWAAVRKHDIMPYLDATRPLRVLDLANGSLRPQYFLLKSGGADVYGIDLVNMPGVGWKDKAYIFARWLYTRQIGLRAKDRI